MAKLSRKILYLLAGGYTLSFIFLFSLSLINFPAREVLSRFFWSWSIDAGLSAFIRSFIPIHAAILLIGYSLFFTPEDLGQRKQGAAPLFAVISRTLVILVVILFGYSLLAEVLLPTIHAKQEERKHISSLAVNFRNDAEEAIADGDFRSAELLLTDYLRINPADRTAVEMLETAAERAAAPERQPSDKAPDTRNTVTVKNMNAAQLIEEALSYLDQEDFFSAHYYASLAAQISPDRKEPRRIMAFAWEKISNHTPGKDELARTDLYEKKRDGYTSLVQGDPVSAYYIFTSLEGLYPADQDVKKYLARSIEALKEVSFFTDEVEEIPALSGSREIVFLNRNDETLKEILTIDKLVNLRGNIYAQGVECIGISRNGTVTYHLSAAFGKIARQHLYLQGIGRNDSGNMITPVYHSGSRDDAVRNIIRLSLPPGDLPGFSRSKEAGKSLNIAQLWRLSTLSELHGYRKEVYQMEILERILRIFAFIILSFLAIGLGWRLRSRYRPRPPVIMLGIVPFLPYAADFLFQIYFYLHRIVGGFLLLSFDLTLTAALIAVIEGCLLFFVLIFLSRQVADEARA